MAGTVTASVLKNDTTSPPQFQNSAGTQIGQLARAWVNFAGSTGTINASFNVSSITRNGAGDYTVTFTSSFADANYSKVVTSGYPSGGGVACPGYIMPDASQSGSTNPTYSAPTISAFRFMTSANSNMSISSDPGVVSVAVFR